MDKEAARKWFESQILSVFGTENVEMFQTEAGTLYARKMFGDEKEILFSHSPKSQSFVLTLNGKYLALARTDIPETMSFLENALKNVKQGNWDSLKKNSADLESLIERINKRT